MFRTFRLQRYIFLDCWTFFLLALSAFTGVLLTVQLLRLSDLVVNRGVAGSDIAMMFVAVVPTFLELAIPMAAVVGIMLAISRLSADAELIVMRASGVSLYQLLPAIITFGLMLTLCALAVTQILKPWGSRTVSELLFKIAQDRTTAGLEPGVFNNLGSITLYPEQIDYQTGRLTRVLLDQRDTGGGRRIFFAESGQMLSDPVTRSLLLELESGEIHEQAPAIVTTTNDGATSRVGPVRGEGGYSVTRFTRNSIDIGPEMLGPQEKNDETPIRALSGPELRATRDWYANAATEISGPGIAGIPLAGEYRSLIGLKTEKEAQRRLHRLEKEIALRWSAPFSALLLALVAFPLGVQPPRGQSSWGPGASLAIGIGVFLLYYGLLSLGFGLAERDRISEYVAVWIPNILAALIAFLMNRSICSERSQSIGESVAQSITSLAKRGAR